MDEPVEIPTPDELDALIQSNPDAALRVAQQWVARAVSPAEERIALIALGRSRFELGHATEAEQAVRRALGIRVTSAVDLQWVQAVMSAAAILADGGHVDEGLSAMDAVEPEVPDRLRGRMATQRAYILCHAGQLGEALEWADRAEPMLRSGGDELGLLRLYVNRGLILLQQGRLDGALRDFETALVLADALDQEAMSGLIHANIAVVHARARQPQASLREFELAEQIYLRSGAPGRMIAILQVDRAESLMHMGLLGEAASSARDAVARASSLQLHNASADATLLLARILLRRGEHRLALAAAVEAARLLDELGRTRMSAVADAVAAEIGVESADDDGLDEALDRLGSAATRVGAAGWQHLADELRYLGLVSLSRRGRPVSDRLGLERLRLGAFSGLRNEALIGWYAESVARSLDGDISHAVNAATVGLDLVDEIVAESQTLEQRSAAVRVGADLSQLIIDLAVERGDADTVLAAAEGTRARALQDELHETRPHEALTHDGARQLRRELAVRLGERTLVEWIVSRGAVWAVVFDASGSRLVRVADVRDVVRARDRVVVWLDLAAAEPDDSSVRAMRAAALLDELLIEPLGLPPDNGIVMVPVGLLHGVPWAGLGTFAGRPMTLAPNARLWLEADRRAASSARTVGLVTGPDVEAVAIERKAVGRWFPDAAIAAGAGATASTVRSMFGGYDLVHVAAHGRFRSDRPLLSTLLLHDGESTLYDAVPDRIGARLVILSSCEGGAHGTADGSEVLGLSSVMLARGAASVLAPLTVVRDLECADFVADVHAELAAGEPLACAVANVRGRWLADDDLSRWAVASSFTCFGSGASTVVR